MHDRAPAAHKEGAAPRTAPGTGRDFLPSVGRAAAGALLFSLPTLLTSEMWELSLSVDPLRVALLFAILPALLTKLNGVAGFRETERLRDDVADAFVAIAVALLVALAFLACFGVIGSETGARDLITKLVVQAVPGSFGAVLARSQFGSHDIERRAKQEQGAYGGELFIMIVGSLVLMLPLVPTEEIVAISYKMRSTRLLVLLVLTLSLMHVTVYTVKLREGDADGERGFWSLLARYTIVSYAVVMVVAAYLLWTAGRTDGLSAGSVLGLVIVLGLPGGLGAAIARLIL